MKPAQPAGNPASTPADMFGNDEALKEQEAAARAAKAQREKEEKERREKERKEREKKEKEKKKKGPAGLKRPSTKSPMRYSRTMI